MTLVAGLWQKNDDAKRNIESDSETLAVVDADIAKNQAKLDAVKRDLDAKKAKLAAVNAQIGEKTTDVASLLAREASPFHVTFVRSFFFFPRSTEGGLTFIRLALLARARLDKKRLERDACGDVNNVYAWWALRF